MRSELRVVASPAVQAPRGRAEVLRERAGLFERLAETERELAALEPGGHGELVDVVRSVPGPKRSIMSACRAGKVAGAVRVARRWLAPRESIDTWLRQLGPRPVHDEKSDDLEDLRRRLARRR